MALPKGAVGWSALWNCGITWSYSLTFFEVTVNNISVMSGLLPEREGEREKRNLID